MQRNDEGNRKYGDFAIVWNVQRVYERWGLTRFNTKECMPINCSVDARYSSSDRPRSPSALRRKQLRRDIVTRRR